jgi:hypothetical protein
MEHIDLNIARRQLIAGAVYCHAATFDRGQRLIPGEGLLGERRIQVIPDRETSSKAGSPLK